jgi:predicted metal-dependent hydrolase
MFAIQVRHPELDLAGAPRYWYGGDPFRTHFMNALSSVFPDGEAWFVRSVLHYRDRIDDAELGAAIRAFAGQEGLHSRHHRRHVELLEAQGYWQIAVLNRWMRRGLEWLSRRAPLHSLANTVALEHLTALLARQLMSRPETWAAEMDPRMARLWQWHALEEAEHKAVAFEVLRRVSDAHARRVAAQLLSTFGLALEIWIRLAILLYADGLLFRPRLWLGGVRWLFGHGGILRGFGGEYLRWYRRDFHPDEIDDRPLIEAWRERVAA